MSAFIPRPGDLVDVWDAGGLVAAVVTAEEKGRWRVVTERGDEIRVTASRIAHRAAAGTATEPPRAAAIAARHAEASRRIAAEVDVASLWEILVDAGGRHAIEDLAALALGARSVEGTSGLLRRLAEERTWFERKGDAWEARGREAVEETLRRIRTEDEKARRRETFVAWARGRIARGAARDEGGAEAAERETFLRRLVDLAVRGDDAPERKDATALIAEIGAAGATPALAAFDALVRLGVFDPDENLEVRRYALRESFPPEVVDEAARLARRGPPPEPARRDLTALAAFTVDDEETREIDDALSWEPEGDGGVAGVHIADPAALIAPGSSVDEEALRRGATHYLPDRRLPMLPGEISEAASSLVAGEPRPSLSFLVRVDGAGRILESEIVPATIRSRARLTYAQADNALRGDAPEVGGVDGATIAGALRRLEALARLLESERAAAGAVLIRAPEIDVSVGPGGEVRLKRIDERGPSRRIVAEMMILANRIAAAFCAERGLPAIWRRQAAPDHPPAPLGEGAYDPVAVRAIRRSLRRGEVGLAPAPHYALGLPAYLQATSPLRRYQDLAVHRQILASLAGASPPYDAAAISRIAATTEEAERSARAAEAGCDAYWILKWLEARSGSETEAVVLSVEARRTEIELSETLTTASVAPRPDHAPGQRLRVVIEEARPRQGLLRLREVGPAG